MSADPLTYQILREAIAGHAAAFRVVTDLDPAGGAGDKVFPPTYQGGTYARETRMIDGQPEACVLLDSVQSQANRLELALLDWFRRTPSDQEKPFPLVQIDFAGTEASEVGIFSALEAPHRIVDAVFLASEILGDEGNDTRKPFRHPGDPAKSSSWGKLIDSASSLNATGILALCPTALLFGMWDSHGARGGLGEKFQRALVSEIIGVGVTDDNKRPASRVDPLIVVAGDKLPITIASDKTWVVDEKGKTKLSKVGLGNVTPSLQVPGSTEYNHGGVTMEFARQIAVLSLPALRRLHFPVPVPGKESARNPDADIAAQCALAALALAAVARQWESGFSLRSRCDLVPRDEMKLTLVSPGATKDLLFDSNSAKAILANAVISVRQAGLPWPTDRDASAPWKGGALTLRPNAALAKAVARSRQLAAEPRD